MRPHLSYPALTQVSNMLHVNYLRRESAQGLVEYGLVIALVAVLAIAALLVFGPAVTSLISNLGASV